MTPKKLIYLLLIIFSTISFIRLLILTSITTSDPIPRPPPPPSLSSRNRLRSPNPLNPPPTPTPTPSSEPDPFSPKELLLLQTLISTRSPCNLLFFGITPQLLDLAKSNTAGNTIIFLVNEEFDRGRTHAVEGIGIYYIECEVMAKQAYDLLKYVRMTPTCRPNDGPTYESRCRLALRGLPEIVNKVRWDVIVVDGPGGGGGPEEPGRMAAIYTAALLARAGNSTDVLVHNVDRTIEKWYSWEFLCRENLISSKGRLWHFRIRGRSNSGRFCSEPAFKIQ